jgi:hypothetical protein
MGRTLTAYGLSAPALHGWDVRIERRHQLSVHAPASTAPIGGYVHPVLHAANSRLPVRRGDYGSGYVETMTSTNVFVSLAEFDRDAGRTELFEDGQPHSLRTAEFHPDAQQRVIAGMCGTQRFFTHNGRAFCLYVVLGSWAQRRALVPTVNRFVSSIRIASR